MARFIARSRGRQGRAGRLALAICLCAVAGAAAGWGQAPQTFGVSLPQRVTKSLKPVRLTPSEKAGIALVAVPEVRLEAIDRDKVLQEDAMNERTGKTKVLRFGVARGVQVAAADGNWYDVGGGARLWVGDVVATAALGIRLHFKDVHLPAGAELAVYGPGDKSGASGTLKNGFPGFDPERHVELYQGSEAQGQRTDFWTGTLLGERVRIEYLVPAGAANAANAADAAAVPFAVDSLQHLYLDPVAKLAKSLMTKSAGDCHNDVTCFPEWADVAKSVSGLGIVFAGGTGFCTGQLINDLASDFTPYYLTAHHCLSTKSEAASSEYFWLY
ncbi:MAG TPA: hypothetical protein VFC23_04275, partial [Thermoanaerobaculia bacterium]|nr:hypothetical protein [Thermoanaerobaculia bacterium]